MFSSISFGKSRSVGGFCSVGVDMAISSAGVDMAISSVGVDMAVCSIGVDMAVCSVGMDMTIGSRYIGEQENNIRGDLDGLGEWEFREFVGPGCEED